jgi:hypothetical protein
MVAYLSIIIMLIGLVLYLAPAPAKIMEVGRIMFAVGLLVAVAQFGARALKLL